jgi:UDP-N-acetylmuramate dehydrogenase
MPSGSTPLTPQAQVPLAPFTTLGIGGAAEWFVTATTPEDVTAAHRWSADRGLPLFVMGGGSNVVISDRGVRGLVLAISIAGIDLQRRSGETIVTAGAGVPWDPLVETAVNRGLAGIECLSGIPGSVGGTPIQNVGAYGQEVSAVIQDVTAFDRSSGTMTVLPASACDFGYRTSRFKQRDASRFIVCGVRFRLQPGVPSVMYPDVVKVLQQRSRGRTITVRDVREAVLAIRRSKGMVLDPADSDTRSVGSFFTNPIVPADTHAKIAASASDRVAGFPSGPGRVKMSAAWLIERSGFGRGHHRGAVGLSSKHTLAIVNRGGASARDVLDFAAQIKRAVIDRFGIWLVPEPAFIGLNDEPELEFLKRGG